MGRSQRKSRTSTDFNITISLVYLISLSALFMNHGIQGVESFDYDDYGGDPYGGGDPSGREDMMSDINSQRSGYPNELSTRTKKFKLFEKRRLNHEKAKAFCKKREGQLAQAMNLDEMQRIQTLLMRGTSISSNVWVGADKREWKKHASKMIGLRPNLPANAMMMGGGPTAMCPAMSISTRSLAPVECFKEFPFICEFPPGKGNAPAKTGKKEKKKTTRKDEMRRKREIIKLSPDTDDFFSPTQSYDFTRSFSSTTGDIPESITPGSVDPNQPTTGPVEEFERHNKLSFHPRVVFSSKKSGNETDAHPPYRPGLVKDDAPAAIGNTRNSTKRDHVDPGDGLNNKVDKGKTVPEVHPDQQMLNLFDEQLNDMQRIIWPDQHRNQFLRTGDQQKTGTTQTQNEENTELTSNLPLPTDDRMTTTSIVENDEQSATNNQIYTEEPSISTSEASRQESEDSMTENAFESLDQFQQERQK